MPYPVAMNKRIGLALVAAASLGLMGCQNQAANVEGSREAAEKWVADMLPGYEMVTFSSATLDSDEDGYVTADITVRKKGTQEPLKMIQLETPTKGIILQLQKGQGAKLKQIPYNNEF